MKPSPTPENDLAVEEIHKETVRLTGDPHRESREDGMENQKCKELEQAILHNYTEWHEYFKRDLSRIQKKLRTVQRISVSAKHPNLQRAAIRAADVLHREAKRICQRCEAISGIELDMENITLWRNTSQFEVARRENIILHGEDTIYPHSLHDHPLPQPDEETS